MNRTRFLIAALLVFASVSASLGVSSDPADAVALSALAVPAGCDQLAWLGKDSFNKLQIYVSAPDGTGRVEVSTADNTSSDPVSSTAPIWSPDGTRIMWKGFVSWGAGIFVSDPDGLNRVEITAVGASPPKINKFPSWSPDSTRIAWAGQDPITHKNEIWVANSDGTARSSISNVGVSPPTGNDRPVWSPDGTKIAWRAMAGGVSHVFVANVDGSNRVDLIDPVETEYFGMPVWAPDGSALAFTRSTTFSGASNSVYAVKPDGSGFGQVWQASTGSSHADQPVWSPDSSRLAFAAVSAAGVPAVLVVSPDGTGLVNIAEVSPPDPAFTGVRGPVWSPTGVEIAFDGIDTASDQIYVSKVDGSAMGRISTVGSAPLPSSASASIGWAPDGQSIAWKGSISGGGEIFTAASDGSSRLTISRVLAGTVPSANNFPAWRPRSSALALTTTLAVPTLSKPGTFSATVTNTGPCQAGAVTVDAVGAPCLASTGHVASSGTLAGSTWHVGTLASGATASLTITGPGTAPLDCGRTASVGSAPSLPAPVESPVSAVVEPCPAGTDPFVDVDPTSFARAEITCMFNVGITTGRTLTTYEPAEPVSRDEMASFLARTWQTLGEPCPAGTDPFVDVDPSSFARAEITCMFNVGIAQGTSPVTYDPLGEVTREQMAAFLARLWRLRGRQCPAGADPFLDVSPSSFARADIACIFNLGITTGTSTVTYDPSGEVTREQMAAFLIRLVQHT